MSTASVAAGKPYDRQQVADQFPPNSELGPPLPLPERPSPARILPWLATFPFRLGENNPDGIPKRAVSIFCVGAMHGGHTPGALPPHCRPALDPGFCSGESGVLAFLRDRTPELPMSREQKCTSSRSCL
jgi:hypothetical protein